MSVRFGVVRGGGGGVWGVWGALDVKGVSRSLVTSASPDMHAGSLAYFGFLRKADVFILCGLYEDLR